MSDRLDQEQDEYLRRRELGWGAEAKALMADDSAFRRAFAALSDDIWDEFRACDATDMATLQRVKLKFDLLGDIQKELQHIVDTGSMAEHQLAEMERQRSAESTENSEEDFEG